MEGEDGSEWLSAVRSFYARVDAAIAAEGLRCGGCGGCCHFEAVDHILYAGGLERKYLLAHATLPETPDADPRLLATGKRCPYQADDRCGAREARPLGCRLHFCEWADSPREMDFAERWHIELKTLHSTLGEEWDYRPLLPL